MTAAGNGSTESTELYVSENLAAEDLITKGDLPGAAKILVDIVSKAPNNYRAYNNIGIISWTRHAWEDAYTMFKRSVSIKPDYADALINLFDGALKLRRIAEVLPYFNTAVAANPMQEEIQIIRDSIASQGDGIYNSERGLVVGVYNPRVEQAHTLIADGKLFEAMDLLLKINDEEGPSAEVFSSLGVISYYQNRYADAFSLFIESIKLNPTSRDAYLNLFDAAKGCNRVKDAQEVYDIYVKDFPFLATIKDEINK
jgi:tetratricopeptide (TPR) repeat protein